jgi:putative inorganic carbon (HCO3(-)) transporter
MGELLLYPLFVLLGVISFVYPWAGIIAGYSISIASPQTIWWYHFESIRPAYWVLLPTLLGAVMGTLSGKVNPRLAVNPIVGLLAVTWLCLTVSVLFAPYSVRGGEVGVRDAGYVFETFSKIYLVAIIACTVIWERRHFSALACVVFAIALYFTFWGNWMYLSGNFMRRLAGPTDQYGNGPYADENNFAALMVALIPFLWFLAFSVSNSVIRMVLLCATPLAWHVVFLTGSRGGLLGLIAAILWIGLQYRNRWIAPAVGCLFLVAFVWQAGDVMKERAGMIDDYREEQSAASRLEAWEASARMMANHPLTGVGPGAFVRAFPNYSDNQPRQAHNTYLQVGAEYGPLAGAALFFAVIAAIASLRSELNQLPTNPSDDTRDLLVRLGQATLCGLVGLFVCSMFLTLQLFEILFFLLFLSAALVAQLKRHRRLAIGVAVQGGSRRLERSSVN